MCTAERRGFALASRYAAGQLRPQPSYLQVGMKQATSIKSRFQELRGTTRKLMLTNQKSSESVPNYNWSCPVKKLLFEAIHLKTHYARQNYTGGGGFLT